MVKKGRDTMAPAIQIAEQITTIEQYYCSRGRGFWHSMSLR